MAASNAARSTPVCAPDMILMLGRFLCVLLFESDLCVSLLFESDLCDVSQVHHALIEFDVLFFADEWFV